MTTAQTIIEDALTFRLNRLSPGESADSNTLAVGLRALNSVVDEINGGRSMGFREALIASTSAVSTASSALTAWSGLAAGDPILGMSWSDTSGGNQTPMSPITMGQYQDITDKTQTGDPEYWAHDGVSVFFWPVPATKFIHARVRLSVTTFADQSTDYTLPKGYPSALTDLVAQRLAPVMGGLTPSIQAAANAARLRLMAQGARPAILDATEGRRGFDINRGW